MGSWHQSLSSREGDADGVAHTVARDTRSWPQAGPALPLPVAWPTAAPGTDSGFLFPKPGPPCRCHSLLHDIELDEGYIACPGFLARQAH